MATHSASLRKASDSTGQATGGQAKATARTQPGKGWGWFGWGWFDWGWFGWGWFDWGWFDWGWFDWGWFDWDGLNFTRVLLSSAATMTAVPVTWWVDD